MIKNLCIWYLRKKRVAVFLNFELMGTDVNVKTRSKTVFVSQLKGEGEFNVYR